MSWKRKCQEKAKMAGLTPKNCVNPPVSEPTVENPLAGTENEGGGQAMPKGLTRRVRNTTLKW